MEGPGPVPVNRAIRVQCRRWQLGAPPSLLSPAAGAWLSTQAAAAAYAPGICSPTELASVLFSPFPGNEWNAQRQKLLPETIFSKNQRAVRHTYFKDHCENIHVDPLTRLRQPSPSSSRWM